MNLLRPTTRENYKRSKEIIISEAKLIQLCRILDECNFL